jgi:transglutaminase-like putative cysteine protease
MKRHENNIMILPLLSTSLLFAIITQDVIIAIIIAVITILSLFLPKGRLDTVGQIIAGLIITALSYIYYFVINEPLTNIPATMPGTISSLLALAGTTFAASRMFIRDNKKQNYVTASSLLIAIICLGSAKTGWIYVSISYLSLGLVLFALNKSNTDNSSFFDLSFKIQMVSVILIAMAFMGAVFFTCKIPIWYSRVIDRYAYSKWRDISGFSPVIELGSLNDMLLDDRVELRIFISKKNSPVPLYLRGIVYNKYSHGIWSSRPEQVVSKPEINLYPMQNISNKNVILINTVNERLANYFIPVNAKKIYTDDTPLISPFGTLKPKKRCMPLAFLPDKSFRLPEVLPNPYDLQLKADLKKKLRTIADKITFRQKNNPAKVAAIADHLKSNFRYSLNFRAKGSEDPVINFLTRLKKGNCEYFASAIALLARSLGIPARVAGGYRAVEFNSFGHYYIVRRRNAHTWAELWFKKRGWIRIDPTPEATEETEVAAALFIYRNITDYIAVLISRGFTQLKTVRPLYPGVMIFALIFVWAGIRVFRKKEKKQIFKKGQTLNYSEINREFYEFMSHLEKKGLGRNDNETLEQWAERIKPENEKAAILIQKYIKWRYGKKGEINLLTAKLQEMVIELSDG